MLAVGGVFSSNFKSFFKGSNARLFKKGDDVTEDYEEDNDAIMKGEGMDDGGDDLENKLEELKNAIEDGSVELTEESIRDWASSNGISDEDTNFIVSTLVGGGEAPDADLEKSEGYEEDDGEHMEPDGDEEEFQKSMISYFRNLEKKISLHSLELKNFKKSTLRLRNENEKKDKEIKFLKSEISKLANSPVGQKAPVKESLGMDTSGLDPRKAVIQKIKKGMSQNICTLDDLMTFEATGKKPGNFDLIKE